MNKFQPSVTFPVNSLAAYEASLTKPDVLLKDVIHPMLGKPFGECYVESLSKKGDLQVILFPWFDWKNGAINYNVKSARPVLNAFVDAFGRNAYDYKLTRWHHQRLIDPRKNSSKCLAFFGGQSWMAYDYSTGVDRFIHNWSLSNDASWYAKHADLAMIIGALENKMSFGITVHADEIQHYYTVMQDQLSKPISQVDLEVGERAKKVQALREADRAEKQMGKAGLSVIKIDDVEITEASLPLKVTQHYEGVKKPQERTYYPGQFPFLVSDLLAHVEMHLAKK